ncbi:YhgE/Pip domain-containing protein [Bacillus sonorensis]|uniref:YhgE/Pip domain-containing protein n=1 Tax=Bacillus sonorensis TaxID=119858 RepID=UPI00098B499B|nr:ABC transporter permease [Bacillus sonorensis]
MTLLKEKMVLLAPFVVLLVILIFSLTLIPSVHPEPKNLPIAIVNEDQGAELPGRGKLNRGAEIALNIKKETSGEDAAVKWIDVKNEKSARNGLNDRTYYAALIIPKDFSQKQSSLQTAHPAGAKVKILINQGANTIAANAAGQMLNQLVEHINQQVREQLLTTLEKRGAALSAEQASLLAAPIEKDIENVNKISANSANGNAPVSLVQPLWMASIAGALLIFAKVRKLRFFKRTEALFSRLLQGLIGAVLAAICGYGLVWIAGEWVGMNIPQFHETALFIALCYFSFYLMIAAVTAWVGLSGAGIFGILFFFGTPLLTLAPEMMSAFYRDWVYSWLPMRFASEGLRDLLFFDKGLDMNQPVTVLLAIGTVSFLLLLAAALKPQAVSKEAEEKISF